LHIISGLNTGGAERSLQRLCSALGSTHEFAVVNLSEAKELVAEFSPAPWQYDFKRRPYSELKRLSAAAADFAPDVIQGWMYHGNGLASLIGHRLGRRNIRPPVVWSMRHSLEHLGDEKLSLRALIYLQRSSIFQPRRLVYNSHCGWQTHANIGFGTKPSMIIPNGVDTEYFRAASVAERDAARAAFDIRPGERLLGCLARFHPMKGIETLLQSFASLRQQQRSGDAELRLLLAGSGMSTDNEALIAQLEHYGLRKAVVLAGVRSDARRLYAAMDVLVLASHFGEGTPNVLLEAMASSVPVLATRVGDSERVVVDERWLVAPNDAEALEARLAALFELSTSAVTELVAANRARIGDNYSLDQCHTRYDELYQELCSVPGSCAA
jgi:glycosyltransferase involved in cell wall biosynthesis